MTKGDKTKAEYAELDGLDKKILELRLKHPSITDREIGALVGLSRRAVNKRENRTAFKAAHDQFTQEPIETLRASLKKAARVVVKALDATDERLKARMAVEILRSEGVMKQRADGDGTPFEPLIIETESKVITVSKAPQKQLAREVKDVEPTPPTE